MQKLAPEIISELESRLTELLHPDDILLFGSYVKGNATKDSDVDIMVIMPNGSEAGRQRTIEARRYIQDIFYDRNLAFDLVMRTQEAFDRYKHRQGTLQYEIAQHGVSLHAL